MKRLTVFVFFVLFFTTIFSQEQSSKDDIRPNNVFGFFSNFGICQPVGSHVATDIVTPHGKEAYSLGFRYQRPISKKFSIETGICYSKYAIINHLVDHNINDYLHEILKTISVPVLLRQYYPNNYFLRFGSMIEFGLSRKGEYGITDAQTGFGISIGAGKEFFLNKFSLDIAPNLDIHSIIPFSSHLFQQKLIVLGLKIGLCYNLN